MKKMSVFLILLLALSTLIYAQNKSTSTFMIPLIYPQEDNAPRRVVTHATHPVVVQGEIMIKASQLPLIFNGTIIEYYLNEKMISTGTEKNGFSCKFDTRCYTNGAYTITANLYDNQGITAIGIQRIMIQNQEQEE